MTSQNIQSLDVENLTSITGGATARPAQHAPTPAQDAQLRDLARNNCPVTYRQFQNTPVLTRAMGERCLDEAGYGMFKGRLDQYFGPRTAR